jgi:hypothetical protein
MPERHRFTARVARAVRVAVVCAGLGALALVAIPAVLAQSPEPSASVKIGRASCRERV